MATRMSMQEKKWQAESDARTLAEAQVIAKDRGRLSAARTQAKAQAKEKMAEAKAMASIARKKVPSRKKR